MQAEEVSIVEQAADHFLRDLARARFVEFRAVVEFHSDVEASKRCLHAGCNRGLGFHDHNGTAISIK